MVPPPDDADSEADFQADTLVDSEADTSAGSKADTGGDSGRGSRGDSSPPDPTDEGETGPTAGPGGRREVVVPMDLFKVVTVFSTIIAVGLVVLGFVLLDTGTTMLGRGSAEGGGVVGGLVALAGIGVILGGAAVYVYATRFRTRGMGKPKDDAGESPE